MAKKAANARGGGTSQGKKSTLNQSGGIYQALSNKQFPSYEGRQSSMLEFFAKKSDLPAPVNDNRQAKDEEEQGEDDDVQVVQPGTGSPMSRYYVTDFLTVTETVFKRDHHLLNRQETNLIDCVVNVLSDDAKHLFVRLYNRKGPWFQIGMIDYPEIKDTNKTIGELIDTHMLEEYSSTIHDYKELAPLLPVDKLRRIVGPSCPTGATKPTLIELIGGNALPKGQSTLFSSTNKFKSTSMIVNNIRGITFPRYKVWDSSDGNEYAYGNEEENNLLAIIESCADSLSPMVNKTVDYTFALKFTPGWVRTRVLWEGVKILEKRKKYETALDQLMLLVDLPYCIGKRGEWWLRTIINRKHTNSLDEALVVCERALKDPYVKSGDRLALESQYIQLAKARKHKILDGLITISDKLQVAKITTVYSDKVEGGLPGRKSSYGVALDHYAKTEGWQGIHCETSLFITLYTLFFWDIIFSSDVPHVFLSPFQDAPLDFGMDEFYLQRKELMDNRIEFLKASDCKTRQSLLEDTWNSNHGCNVRGVNWDKWTLEQLCELSKALGGGLLGFSAKLLAEDYGCFSRGMPDLLLWKLNEADKNRETFFTRFVEVKGVGDSLRSQQKVWIDMLMSFGCDVEMCHVKNN
eukprot:gene19855-23785_t